MTNSRKEHQGGLVVRGWGWGGAGKTSGELPLQGRSTSVEGTCKNSIPPIERIEEEAQESDGSTIGGGMSSGVNGNGNLKGATAT